MVKLYSLDFKQQVLKKYELLKNVDCILNLYGISRMTLFRWIAKNKNNKLDIKHNSYKTGNPYKIDTNKLNELNQDERENYTLQEVANIMNTTAQAIYYHFVKNKITFKKKSYDTERV